MIEVFEYELKDYHALDGRYFGEEYYCKRPECTCGKIQAFTHPQKGGGLKTSCDILNSGKGQKVNQNAIPSQFLYRRFPTKITPPLLQKMVTPEARQRLQYEDVRPLFILIQKACKQMETLTGACGATTKRLMEQPKILWDSKYLSKLLAVSRESFLLHWETQNDLIMMGDLHGSFHTFWRNILRLRLGGVLTSLQSFELRRGISLVLTGDITDRGMFAFDIFRIVLQLISSNPPGSVILIRGNHESWEVNTKSGFLDELRIKFKGTLTPTDVSNLCELPEYAALSSELRRNPRMKWLNEVAWHILMQFQKFYSTCPCAVIVEEVKTKERLWIAHGGFPMTRIELTGQSCVPLTPRQAEACMWHDFFCTEGDAAPHGRIRILPKALRAFMKAYRISFVIRGHQDLYANTYLLSNNIVEIANASGIPFDLEGAYHQREGLVKVAPDQSVGGPIARVFTSLASWLGPRPLLLSTPLGTFDIHPVLTISTCTDLGRNHMKDSMIYVSFQHNQRPLLSMM